MIKINIFMDGVEYIFNPTKDITAYETAMMFQYLMVAMHTDVTPEVRSSYFYDHGLTRHFTKKD